MVSFDFRIECENQCNEIWRMHYKRHLCTRNKVQSDSMRVTSLPPPTFAPICLGPENRRPPISQHRSHIEATTRRLKRDVTKQSTNTRTRRATEQWRPPARSQQRWNAYSYSLSPVASLGTDPWSSMDAIHPSAAICSPRSDLPASRVQTDTAVYCTRSVRVCRVRGTA